MNCIFEKLKMSKFRNSFHLKQKDKDYINKKGINVIKQHCLDFINKRLANPLLFNDGKQTPTKGHPVFIAQHATATCCRKCLFKWHKIEKTHILTQQEKDYICLIIMEWINLEINNID